MDSIFNRPMNFDNDRIFNLQYERLKQSLNVNTDSGLAKKLGITQQSVREQKRDKEYPLRWLKIIVEQYGIASDQIILGTGNQKLHHQIWKESCDRLIQNRIDAEGLRRQLLFDEKKTKKPTYDALELALLLVIKAAKYDINMSPNPITLEILEKLFKDEVMTLKQKVIFALQTAMVMQVSQPKQK